VTCTVVPLFTPPLAQPGVSSPSVEMPLRVMVDGSTPREVAVAWTKAAAKAAAAGLVVISSGESQQSSNAVGCREFANSVVTWTVVPPAVAPPPPLQPGSSSPSVEMPLSTMSSTDTPS